MTVLSNPSDSLTGDMRTSHGCTADGVASGITGMPGACDARAGCKEIHTCAVVGEGRSCVTAGRRSDSYCLRDKTVLSTKL